MRGRGPGWVLYLMYDAVVYSSTTSMPWLCFYSILNLRVGWTIIDRILASHGRMLFHRESADNSFDDSPTLPRDYVNWEHPRRKRTFVLQID
jgi:hypothetical protein